MGDWLRRGRASGAGAPALRASLSPPLAVRVRRGPTGGYRPCSCGRGNPSSIPPSVPTATGFGRDGGGPRVGKPRDLDPATPAAGRQREPKRRGAALGTEVPWVHDPPGRADRNRPPRVGTDSGRKSGSYGRAARGGAVTSFETTGALTCKVGGPTMAWLRTAGIALDGKAGSGATYGNAFGSGGPTGGAGGGSCVHWG